MNDDTHDYTHCEDCGHVRCVCGEENDLRHIASCILATAQSAGGVNERDPLSEAEWQIGEAETALVRARVALRAADQLDLVAQLRAISEELKKIEIPE
jgi:hypothetical protein